MRSERLKGSGRRIAHHCKPGAIVRLAATLAALAALVVLALLALGLALMRIIMCP